VILMISRPVGSLKLTQKKFLKRYLSKQLRFILGMGKKTYFWCVTLKDKTSLIYARVKRENLKKLGEFLDT